MILIPARQNSSRFNNKILAPIFGIPMAIATAIRVSDIDDVVIATDSDELCNEAKKHNIKTYKSTTTHNSGTDRINELANHLGLDDDEIVINVQADEPFIEPYILQELKDAMNKLDSSLGFKMASCYKIVTKAQAQDPNLVKVVTNNQNKALYFSRSLIPFVRDEDVDVAYKAHLGIYAYTKKSLNIFCELNAKELVLEEQEKLEQLRVLEGGYDISMIEVKTNSFGIDTKEDLQKAIKAHSKIK